jgi:hypothetical protein
MHLPDWKREMMDEIVADMIRPDLDPHRTVSISKTVDGPWVARAIAFSVAAIGSTDQLPRSTRENLKTILDADKFDHEDVFTYGVAGMKVVEIINRNGWVNLDKDLAA